MRRSISRGRRSTPKDEPGLISHAMPRLLTEHDDVNTAFPPTFPSSPKSRRQLRAQLFGLDSILQPELGKDSSAVPIDRCRALAGGHSPQCSLDEQSAKAIALLRELNKAASIVESIELAPSEQSTSISPSSSTDRALSRRRSLYKPGEATRPKSSQSTPATHHVDTAIPSVPKHHDRRDHLGTPARPRMQRAVTPGEFDNLSLGTHELGSLRITNDHAPAPPPCQSEELSAATMVKQNRAPDYFAGAQPAPRSVISQNYGLAKKLDRPQVLAKNDKGLTKGGAEGDSTFLASSNEKSAAEQPLSHRRSSKRGSVLVGHRRHAQQRANTTGFNYEQGNSPYSISSLGSADEALTDHGGDISGDTLNLSNLAHAPLSPLSAVPDVRPQLLCEKSSSGSTNILSPSPAPSNALLSLDGSSNESACGSRASMDLSNSGRSHAEYNENDDISSPDSPTSVYSVQDDAASVIEHNRPPTHGKTHLEIPAPQSLRSSGSVLSESSRNSNSGPRPPASSGSMQASSRQSRSPTRPNKLQKRRPSPEKPNPTDELIVRGQQAPLVGVPDPSSALLSAHATRMDNNPGMDHLTETHSATAKRSLSAESAAVPPASLLFRFPSPTPSLEVDARDQKSFFRSMSHSRKRTGTNAKEQPVPIQITRDDLGDVLGVLDASPYDCASPPRTRTISAQQKLNKQPVLHPHQISGSVVSNTRGMSDEDATALAMQRSRDRAIGAAELGGHSAGKPRSSTSSSPQRLTEKPRAAQPPPSPFPSVDGKASSTRPGRPQGLQPHILSPEESHNVGPEAMVAGAASKRLPPQGLRPAFLPQVEAEVPVGVGEAQFTPITDPAPVVLTFPISAFVAPVPIPTPSPATAPPQQIQQPLPKRTLKPTSAPNVYQPPASWASPPPSALRPPPTTTKRPTTSKSSSWKRWKKAESAPPAIMPFQPLVLNLSMLTPSRSPSPLPGNATAEATINPAAMRSQTQSTPLIPNPMVDSQTRPPPPPHGASLPSKLTKTALSTPALPRPPSRAHSFLKRPYSSRKSKKRPVLPEVPPQLPALSLDFGPGFDGLEDGAWVEYGGGEEEAEGDRYEDGGEQGEGVEDEWVGKSRLYMENEVPGECEK